VAASNIWGGVANPAPHVKFNVIGCIL